ncbi:hypothetical protein R3P38DRAFT_3042573 [Favolaschia claudopus]|uniref:F-box domain-containing protein n=1 Tax=Favolaschia claudopus TaxID=2862362 RepID=A0AAW0A901_9AGAR
MHRCWDIAELVEYIFTQLNPHTSHGYELQSVNRPQAIALYHLAQTCRRLCDPALDVLWRTTQGVVLLLKCLPINLWEIRDGRFEILSPLNIDHWQRFLGNSRRVKAFSACDGTVVVGQSAIESMMSLSPGTVLPNVRGLSCHASSVLFPYLAHILGSRVATTAIFLDGPGYRISMLHSFSSYFRSLECVHVSGTTEIAPGFIPSFVSQLPPQLRLLSIQGLTPATYRHIATCPNLAYLDVFDLIAMPFPGPYPEGLDTAFPALDELLLTASNTLFPANFISVLKNARLKKLSIGTSVNSTTSSSFLLLSAICAACVPATLTKLAIILVEDDEIILADQPLYVMSFDFVGPLLVYLNLRHVALSCPLGFELDDNLVEIMARAWPQLEFLRIQGAGLVISESYPTLASLLSLCHHCPHLRTLYLAVDPTIIPTGEKHDPTPTLTFWDPCDSPLQFPDRVAEFLYTVFPMLSISSPREDWAQVNELLVERKAAWVLCRMLVTGERGDDGSYTVS